MNIIVRSREASMIYNFNKLGTKESFLLLHLIIYLLKKSSIMMVSLGELKNEAEVAPP